MQKNNNHTLLTEKYRPSTLDGFIGTDYIKQLIAKQIADNDIQNYLFWGPAGVGKSTLAKIIVNNIDCEYIIINASDERGIDTIREKVIGFAATRSFAPLKLIVLEECLDENTLVTILRKGDIINIPIKDLLDDSDLVKSFNIEKNRIEWKPFKLFDKGIQDVYEIEFENNEIIICTADHKWFVKDINGHVKVIKTTELNDYGEIFNPIK